MTVSSQISRIEQLGDGTTTAFAVNFYFLENSDLKVFVNGVLQTITTNYTVTGAGNPAGGTVTFVSAPANGVQVVIFRDPALTQGLDYIDNDPFPAESHERGLDKLTMIAQRIRDLVSRALRLGDSVVGVSTELPALTGSQLLGTNPGGTGFQLYPLGSEPDTAANIVYVPAGTGAVATTVEEYNQRRVFVQDFMSEAQKMNVFLRTGTLDVSAAMQAAINHSVLNGVQVYAADGVYLVTSKLNIPAKTQLVGTHNSQSAIENGSKILFSPSSVLDLFDAGPTGAFKDGYNISGFHIQGNSVNAAGNSNRAFNLIKVIKSRFTNMRVDGFREAFRLEATINNRFEFIQAANHYITVLNYTGDFATTDVWEQCYISNAPIGVQTNGANLAIRFSKCIFESLTTYGVNIVRESYGFMFDQCYGEDAPNANVATNAMFRVGYDGTTLAGSTQLIINGGVYGGRNAGGVGSFIDADFTDGISIGGTPFISRFMNVINTTANTQNDQVLSTGFTCASVSNILAGPARVSGFYPKGVFNSGTRNQQESTLFGDIFISPTTATTGAITVAVSYTAVKTGNVITLRLPATSGTASATTFFEYGDLLPTRMRPSELQTFPCAIKNADANLTTPGMIFVLNTGAIRVYRDLTAATAFSAGGVAGLGQSGGTSVSWTV